MTARFITLEGIEGSGKSTQAALLAERLRAAGYPTRLTREPGGTPLAGAIRAVLLQPEASRAALAAAGLATSATHDETVEAMLPITEVLLYSAARAQHVVRIREWLAAGEVVISDRYADATRAYQGIARGLDAHAPGVVATLEAIATGGLRPDLTLLLDLPAEEGLRRKAAARAEVASGTASMPKTLPSTSGCAWVTWRWPPPSQSASSCSTRRCQRMSWPRACGRRWRRV